MWSETQESSLQMLELREPPGAQKPKLQIVMVCTLWTYSDRRQIVTDKTEVIAGVGPASSQVVTQYYYPTKQ